MNPSEILRKASALKAAPLDSSHKQLPHNAVTPDNTFQNLSTLSPISGIVNESKPALATNTNYVRKSKEYQHVDPNVDTSPQVKQDPENSYYTEATDNPDYMSDILPDYDFSNMSGLLEADDNPPADPTENEQDDENDDNPPADPTDTEEVRSDDAIEDDDNPPADPTDDETPVDDETMDSEDDTSDNTNDDDNTSEDNASIDSENVDDDVDDDVVDEDAAKRESNIKNKHKLFTNYSSLLTVADKLYEKIDTFKYREELKIQDKYDTYTFLRNKVNDVHEMLNDLLTKKFTKLEYDHLVYIYSQVNSKLMLLSEMFIVLFADKKTKNKINSIE